MNTLKELDKIKVNKTIQTIPDRFARITINPSWFQKVMCRLYWLFMNPYRVNMPNGYCPVQCEGVLKTGEYYYFTSRGTGWHIDICATESDWYKNIYLYQYGEPNWCNWPEAGWMSQITAMKLMTKSIKEYYNENRN